MNQLSGLSLDIVVLIVGFIVLVVYGFYFGKSKLLACVLSFYPAVLLYNAFPYFANVTIWHENSLQTTISHGVVFLVFFILTNIALFTVLHGDFSFSKKERFFQIGVLAFCGVLLIMY